MTNPTSNRLAVALFLVIMVPAHGAPRSEEDITPSGGKYVYEQIDMPSRRQSNQRKQDKENSPPSLTSNDDAPGSRSSGPTADFLVQGFACSDPSCRQMRLGTMRTTDSRRRLFADQTQRFREMNVTRGSSASCDGNFVVSEVLGNPQRGLTVECRRLSSNFRNRGNSTSVSFRRMRVRIKSKRVRLDRVACPESYFLQGLECNQRCSSLILSCTRIVAVRLSR